MATLSTTAEHIRYPGNMAARHVGRLASWTMLCGLVPAVLGSGFGRPWILIGIALSITATVWLVLWLPRSAHGAFEAARYGNAARRYRLIESTAFTATRER